MKRLLIALLIAGGIYGFAVRIGTILYLTETIPTGATHNDCGELKQEIADRDYGGDESLVPQEQLKNETIACLDTHELTPEEAFKTEWLFWSIWPGVICGLVFLLWPTWTRILVNQEEGEAAEEAPRLEPGA
jgi:hypothetical protein